MSFKSIMMALLIIGLAILQLYRAKKEEVLELSFDEEYAQYQEKTWF